MFYLAHFDDVKIAFLPLAYLLIIFIAGFGVFKGLKSIFMAMLSIIILLFISSIVVNKASDLPASFSATILLMDYIFVTPFRVLYFEIVGSSNLKFLTDEKNTDFILLGIMIFLFIILAFFYLPARRIKALKIIKIILELAILGLFIYLIVVGFCNPNVGLYEL